MGTKADFYVGKGKKAKWIGSIGSDGFPEDIPSEIWNAKNCKEYRKAVKKFFKDEETQEIATLPDQGWPWSWNDSTNTDYSYTFDKGVHVSSWGHRWVSKEEWKKYRAEYRKWELKMDRYYESLEKYESGERKTEPKEPEKPEDVYDIEGNEIEFPDMSKIKKIAHGLRSGTTILLKMGVRQC